MNKPIVLDRERACHRCGNRFLCYARRKQLEAIESYYFCLNALKSQQMFIALANACDKFDYLPVPLPDPPDDPDEVKYETMIVQIEPGAYEGVARTMCISIKSQSVKLYTHDMKEVV